MYQFQKVLKEINNRLAGLADGEYSIGLGVKNGKYLINRLETVAGKKTPEIKTLASFPTNCNDTSIYLSAFNMALEISGLEVFAQ